MHNVVLFPKSGSSHAVKAAHHIRGALFLLDLSLEHTGALIKDCSPSDNKQKLEHQLQEARMLLDMLRTSAQTIFPNIERQHD